MAEMKVFGISPELRKQFKRLCLEEDISMNQKLIEMIKAELMKAGYSVDGGDSK